MGDDGRWTYEHRALLRTCGWVGLGALTAAVAVLAASTLDTGGSTPAVARASSDQVVLAEPGDKPDGGTTTSSDGSTSTTGTGTEGVATTTTTIWTTRASESATTITAPPTTAPAPPTTSRPPTSLPPTTQPLVTQPPTTEPPTTEPPPTEPPTTEPPPTLPPTTQPPTTQPPTTQPPTTQPPTTQPPTTQPPPILPPVELATVPGVEGLPIGQASQLVREHRLTPVQTSECVVDDSPPPGTVLRQFPAGGTEVAAGSFVRLEVQDC
jgi:hypothetical protein